MYPKYPTFSCEYFGVHYGTHYEQIYLLKINKTLNIDKYTFSLSSAQCQTITNMNTGYGHLMISNTKFFVLGVTPASPYNLQMYKITFLSTPVDWANQIVCALATCSSAVSESILSSDGSTIYSFFTFGSNSIYFAGLSVSNGSVVTSMFKSNTALSGVSGSSMNGDYVVN